DSKPQERKATINRKHGGTLSRNRPAECPVAPTLSRGASVTSLSDKSTISSFGKAVPPPVIPSWPVAPETDIVSTLLEDTPLPPPPPPPMNGDEGAGSETVVAPPPAPPLDMCDFLPSPPVNPVKENCELEPALLLETVPEENSLPPPETDGLFLPAPPPLPHSLENGEARRSRRSRGRRPPSTRSLSLRLRSGSAPRMLHTRSLFLSNNQSLIIPPPPPYPPPLAPPTLSSLSRIPARLQHL
ncbi:ABI family, member 3a isoform X1, partial [Tachysurus ichikawai]